MHAYLPHAAWQHMLLAICPDVCRECLVVKDSFSLPGGVDSAPLVVVARACAERPGAHMGLMITTTNIRAHLGYSSISKQLQGIEDKHSEVGGWVSAHCHERWRLRATHHV